MEFRPLPLAPVRCVGLRGSQGGTCPLLGGPDDIIVPGRNDDGDVHERESEREEDGV